MSKVSSEKLYSNFVKGLVTEANPLTYPENASLDEDNFVLERNGSRSRRLGVDYEFGYSLTDTGITLSQIEGSKQSFHKWESPAGDTSVSIGVIRVYNKLWFIDLLSPSPSASLLNAGNPITISGLSNANIETAVINNSFLLVSADLTSPILLTYNKINTLVTQQNLTISVRDLWGVEDSLSVDTRPTSLSDLHKYNLRNQGWSSKVQTTCGTDAITCTNTTISSFPSNADAWSLGKVGDSTSANYEKYDPNMLIRNSIDNAPAAKGSYILDAFSRGVSRESLSTIYGLPVDMETGKLTTIASYSSRVFYSGISSNVTGSDSKSPNYSGYIFFSQVITSDDKLGKCYQEADPTSPNISDIIDTDGGTIQIPEVTRVVKLLSTQSSLIIFAENGVWEIFGDTGGFIATSFQLAKISAVGISNPKTVVEANGTIFYFAKAGVYALSQDNTSGRYKAENISLTTIQTLYNDISDVAKNNAKGFFDEKENRIRWLYNDTLSYTDASFVNKYNRELVLDLTLKAFYLNSISVSAPYITDYIDIPGYTITTIQEDIYVGTSLVLKGTDVVFKYTDTLSSRGSQFSFLTMVGTSFTISKYNSNLFKDWITYNGTGVNYSSYLVTGYEMFGEVMRFKQVPYILFYFEKTEDGFTTIGDSLQIDHPSSCLVQSQWNWTDSAASGKWGTSFQAYRFNRRYIPSGPLDTFDNGDKVIVTKNKLRGSGRALSLKITSEEGKDMRLLGWALTNTGDGSV